MFADEMGNGIGGKRVCGNGCAIAYVKGCIMCYGLGITKDIGKENVTGCVMESGK